MGNHETVVSFADSIKIAATTKVGLDVILDKIKNDVFLKEKIAAIRATENEGDRSRLKKSLPYFSFCSFNPNERCNENFESTQLLMFDADHVPDLTAFRQSVIADPEVCLAFTSPRGEGLKFAVRLESPITDAAEYTKIYMGLQEVYRRRFGFALDPSTKDAAHATFLSHDPDIYVNADSTPVPLAIAMTVTAPGKSKKSQWEKALKGTTAGNRTAELTKYVGKLMHEGKDEAYITEAMLAWNKLNTPPHDDKKIVDTVAYMYQEYAEQIPPSFEEPCKNYWSHSSEVFEFGVNGGGFYMSKIGKEKFHGFVGATDKDSKRAAFQYLLDEKHISHLHLVNHLADVSINETTYEVAQAEGSVTVRYAPIESRINDNKFIEEYLESRFGQHKTFIKEYLAVFCYTNYRDLPTLVLKGARGSGKNTFAEMVYAIFPALSQTWEVKKGNFSPEAEKKLLIADETSTTGDGVYALLKQYSGSKHVQVNKKYAIPYDVENNMNIIIMSNLARPIYVSKSEKPTSESNNQFFVYDFQPFAGEIDPELDQKLEDRIGYYVRTELKSVYDGLDFTGNRYSIKTPITPEESALFDGSTTEKESAVERIIDAITDSAERPGFEKVFRQLMVDGLIPSKLLEEKAKICNTTLQICLTALLDEEYIKISKDRKRPSINGIRYSCHQMTDKFKAEIKFYEEPKASVPTAPNQCPLL
jgi:hypothetical protein